MRRALLRAALIYVAPAFIGLYVTTFVALSWAGDYAEIQTSDPHPDPQGGYAGYRVWHLYGTYDVSRDFSPTVDSLINIRGTSPVASVIEVIFKPLSSIDRCYWHPTTLGGRYLYYSAPTDLGSGADWGYGCK